MSPETLDGMREQRDRDTQRAPSERRRIPVLRHDARWLVPGLVALLSSCTLALGYPAASVEQCDNLVDDDLDGLLDCADPECEGSCPEQDLEHCLNGRDDDGDGLADVADPRCWSFGVAHVAPRCPAVAATDTVIPGTLRGWAIESDPSGLIEEIADPLVPGRLRLGARTGPGHAGTFSLRPGSVLSGAWVGTHLTTRVFLDYRGATGPATGGSDLVAWGLGSVIASLVAQGYSSSTFFGLGFSGSTDIEGHAITSLAGGWWAIDVSIDDGAAGTLDIHGHARLEGTSVLLTADILGSTGWPATGVLPLEVAGLLYDEAGTTVLLDDLHVVRPGGRLCLDDTPLDPSVDATPQGDAAAWISGATLDGTGRVTMIGLNRGPASWTWDGTTATRRDAVIPSTVVMPPAPAWDPGSARFRGVSPRSSGVLAVLESADGVTWTDVGDAFAVLPNDPPLPDAPMPPTGPNEGFWSYAIGYSVRRARVTSSPEHEIWIGVARGDHEGILFATSASGAPGTFEVARWVDLHPIMRWEGPVYIGDEHPWLSRVSVGAFGGDHVYVVSNQEDVLMPGFAFVARVFVELDDASLVEVPSLAMRPVSEDRIGLARVVLAQLPAPAGSFAGVACTGALSPADAHLAPLEIHAPGR